MILPLLSNLIRLGTRFIAGIYPPAEKHPDLPPLSYEQLAIDTHAGKDFDSTLRV
jgi:hypothetical protein